MSALSRRTFLRQSAVGVFGPAFAAIAARCQANPNSLVSRGYGPLRPVADEATGIELLSLPDGFRYVSFGWTGDRMADGYVTPGLHDGMAVVSEQDGIATLVRNHEVEGPMEPIGDPARSYDAKGSAGCTLLEFDTRRGQWTSSRVGLSGTVRNCAGGVTPWGTWLTCEETVADQREGYDQTHGWVFEVQPDSTAPPTPIRPMGRFYHEAVAIDPETGDVYLTEDRPQAGFYRFQPTNRDNLHAGGRLQILKAIGGPDLRGGHARDQSYDVAWIDLENVEEARSSAPEESQALFKQGVSRGASAFSRLEGCAWSDGILHFTSTTGGKQACGQIWQFDPRQQRVTMLFESPSSDLMHLPDNMTGSPRGGIVVCENGQKSPMRLRGLGRDGRLFPFAASQCDLRSVRTQGQLRDAGKQTEARDYRRDEMCGATFSADGRWLFVNIQTPGITLAVTGPWQDGLI
jgi:secreted PhoX family phosphatase